MLKYIHIYILSIYICMYFQKLFFKIIYIIYINNIYIILLSLKVKIPACRAVW
jgi:hypothetical protein